MKLKLALLVIGLSIFNIAIGAIMSKKEAVILQTKYSDEQRNLASHDFYAFLDASQLTIKRGISNNDAVNDAYSHQDDRKVGLRLYWGNGLIQANFTSQKKTWLGWHRYDTEYHANFKMSSGGGFEFAEGALLGTVTPYVNKDNIPLSISTKELNGNFTIIFGRVTNGRTCYGNMEIWSRGVTYADRGFASISL